ncbi:MAG: CHRD domain-containing protein [Gammaproteobacteria bacterium]|jgi:hypothetical protein
MSRKIIPGMCGVAAALLASVSFAEDFQARLGRVPVDSRTQASIAGLGHASAELDGNRLVIEGDFAGLLGPATIANLHMGTAVGVRGPVIESLRVTADSEGELSGSVRLNAEQVAALRSGRLYIQIHSEIAPEGNLWGWLLSE